MPRVGQAGLNGKDDVVAGTVVMRKGENPREVLVALKAKIAELNSKTLPKDVKLVTFYDRDNLMDFTTRTVMHNLIEGIILVTVMVLILWPTGVQPLSYLLLFLYHCYLHSYVLK